jgi:hypothetical protein
VALWTVNGWSETCSCPEHKPGYFDAANQKPGFEEEAGLEDLL